jgi:hypothetical protein
MDRIAPRNAPTPRTCLTLALVACAGALAVVPSCEWDGNFTILGYSTKPLYDCSIKTIRVPVFKNKTFWVTTPAPGMEMDLTRIVIQKIEQITPYKVVNGDGPTDTELLGTIISLTKIPLNYTQIYEGREWETTLTVEVTWRDCRTGEILSMPGLKPHQRPVLPLAPGSAMGQGPGMAFPPVLQPPNQPSTEVEAPPEGQPGGPSAPGGPATAAGTQLYPVDPVGSVDPYPRKPPYPVVLIRSIGHYRPELGESLTTALWQNYDGMGVQIVSMMEKGW